MARLGIFLFALLLAGAGAAWWLRPPPSAASGTSGKTWSSSTVTRETLVASTVATGTAKPKVGAEVKVGSQISGLVARLFVNVGDKVSKGQLLALLDDEALRARAHVVEAEHVASQVELKFARAQLDRSERLGPNIARNQLEADRRNVAVRETAVTQNEARLADARLQLRYARILAPISGTITSVSTYEGETVAASFAAPTFVTIVDLSRLEIQALVDESDIGRIREGSPVSFRVDAYPDAQLTGKVRTVNPKPQLVNNVVNYVVIIDMDDTRGLLIRPEMTAHVNFVLARREKVLTLPRAAVGQEGEQAYAYVRNGEGWLRRPLRTGMRTPQRVEIVDGLSEGAQVLADVRQGQGTPLDVEGGTKNWSKQ